MTINTNIIIIRARIPSRDDTRGHVMAVRNNSMQALPNHVTRQRKFRKKHTQQQNPLKAKKLLPAIDAPVTSQAITSLDLLTTRSLPSARTNNRGGAGGYPNPPGCVRLRTWLSPFPCYVAREIELCRRALANRARNKTIANFRSQELGLLWMSWRRSVKLHRSRSKRTRSVGKAVNGRAWIWSHWWSSSHGGQNSVARCLLFKSSWREKVDNTATHTLTQ